MRSAIKDALSATGAYHIMRRLTGPGRVDILLYHGFHDKSEGQLARFMPIEQFESQMRLVATSGKPLRLEDLLRDESAAGTIVTIDDGYANNYHLAYRILKQYGVPATIFVTTGFIDRTVPLWRDWLDYLLAIGRGRNWTVEWGDQRIPVLLSTSGGAQSAAAGLRRRLQQMAIGNTHDFLRALEGALGVVYDWSRTPEALRPLGWDEIREMQRSSLVSFGSHTVSHPVLSKCSEAVQWSEIASAHQRLETELGVCCPTFAYPYGKASDYTVHTRGLVAKAGCSLAVSAESGFNTVQTDRLALRRWGADISNGDMRYILAGGPALRDTLRVRVSH